MKKFMTALLFLAITQLLHAGDGEYAVFRIPASLRKNANAVLRTEELRLEIHGARTATFINHYVITILNENGDDLADFTEYYDRFREINSFEGALYDANGKQIKHVKKKDLQDLSSGSDDGLADDNRIKHYSFYYKVYPYTVEYDVEIEYKGTLFFPQWTPQGTERLSVEKSTMSVVCPDDYVFRYKAFNYSGDPVVTHEKSDRVTTWSARNLEAVVREPFSPLWHEITTMVIFGPTEFQMEDYKGNMQNWQDFGRFVNTLKQGRDQLPDAIRQAVHQIADATPDPREKVTRLYQYMQNNTRYVSIQLGIGGWQPFEASFVAAKRYGDCKALTNYMYSLLKEAGINSYYSLIRAGRFANYITDDFPSQQFNHVILCVPLPKDTMWLECTSQTVQAGYLGNFTSDRYALLIDESGGKLVRTPKYNRTDNLESRKVQATLLDDGTLNLKVVTGYHGMQQDDVHGMITHLSRDKVKEYLHEQLDFATYDISSFDYKQNDGRIPSITESLDVSVSNYANITGKRLFIVPNVMTRSHRKLTADTARRYEVQLGYEYKDVDSVEIELPKGFSPEAIPQDVTLDDRFGKYTSSVKLRENKLFYFRTMEFYGGRFPASAYQDLVKFYEAIYKADRNKVVLVRSEAPPAKGF